MSRPACSTLRASVLGTLFGVLTLVLLGTMAVGAIVLGVRAGEGLVVLALFSLVAIGILYGAFRLFRVLFPRTGRLRVEVCEDTIVFQRAHRSEDFLRSDIELIVVDEDRVAGVGSFTVYGPDKSLLGTWETGWFVKPAPIVMRVLERHGYPRALSNPLYGNQLFARRAGNEAGTNG